MPAADRNPRQFARTLTAIVLAAVAAPTIRAETLTTPPTVTPQTIMVTADLRPCVQAMLQGSATFREQYQRVLETPGLVLTARLDATFLSQTIRARSSFRRYSSGLLIVAIEIGPGAPREELIAHEFEHVLEQIDGVDVREHAEHGSGAWFSQGAMIETARAVRAGRAVADEMRHPHHDDKLVQLAP